MTLYLSRLRLARSPSTDALRALIDPSEPGRALDAHHRLLWTVFGDTPDRRRDYLWRAEGGGRFLTLSARLPADAPLFQTPEVKPFAPDLKPGDRLGFSLRVNATKDRPTKNLLPNADGRVRDRRVDIVMDALHALPSEDRAEARMDLAQARGTDWLAAQGTRNGFSLSEVTVADYSVVALPGHMGARKGQPRFGVMEMTGVLCVTDPSAFVDRIAQGFGRARAFGCGLMLIRRIA